MIVDKPKIDGAALQPKPVDPRKPYCCFIGCQNPPTWQVDAHVGLEDDTQSCDDHLSSPE